MQWCKCLPVGLELYTNNSVGFWSVIKWSGNIFYFYFYFFKYLDIHPFSFFLLLYFSKFARTECTEIAQLGLQFLPVASCSTAAKDPPVEKVHCMLQKYWHINNNNNNNKLGNAGQNEEMRYSRLGPDMNWHCSNFPVILQKAEWVYLCSQFIVGV